MTMYWPAILIAMIAAPIPSESPTTQQIKAYLPESVGEWRLSEGPTRYDLKMVYDYMDGAIDVYRRYAFAQLFVAGYRSGEAHIIAELYDMTIPQDAYGFSTADLTGEPVDVASGALYDYGAVRFRRNRYFVRVYDDAGGDANREAVLAVAKAISNAIPDDPTLPPVIERFAKLPLAPRNIRYFHHIDNLNDVYYVSTDNVLLLSEKTEAVMADCTMSGKPLKVVVIRYPDKESRAKAIARFRKEALTDKAIADKEGMVYEKVEDAGYWALQPLDGREKEVWLIVCLDAANPEQCRKAIGAVATLKSKGGED
jgi:hypothetical protein